MRLDLKARIRGWRLRHRFPFGGLPTLSPADLAGLQWVETMAGEHLPAIAVDGVPRASFHTFAPGVAIPVPSYDPWRARAFKFAAILNEIGDEVLREVFP